MPALNAEWQPALGGAQRYWFSRQPPAAVDGIVGEAVPDSDPHVQGPLSLAVMRQQWQGLTLVHCSAQRKHFLGE